MWVQDADRLCEGLPGSDAKISKALKHDGRRRDDRPLSLRHCRCWRGSAGSVYVATVVKKLYELHPVSASQL
eukprot:COSAG05_NODE_86_length_20511_cov_71.945277_6_plen_72_part_00